MQDKFEFSFDNCTTMLLKQAASGTDRRNYRLKSEKDNYIKNSKYEKKPCRQIMMNNTGKLN